MGEVKGDELSVRIRQTLVNLQKKMQFVSRKNGHFFSPEKWQKWRFLKKILRTGKIAKYNLSPSLLFIFHTFFYIWFSEKCDLSTEPAFFFVP